MDRQLTKIINGTTQFALPVFQRNYSWTETQCKQLWKDLLLIANDSNNSSRPEVTISLTTVK